MVRRAFSEDFRAEAVELVLDQQYSIARACKAVGVGETALRRWVLQWQTEHDIPPPSASQLSADGRRIQELEARVAELEREREVLKKSTAFFVRELDRSWK